MQGLVCLKEVRVEAWRHRHGGGSEGRRPGGGRPKSGLAGGAGDGGAGGRAPGGRPLCGRRLASPAARPAPCLPGRPHGSAHPAGRPRDRGEAGRSRATRGLASGWPRETGPASVRPAAGRGDPAGDPAPLRPQSLTPHRGQARRPSSPRLRRSWGGARAALRAGLAGLMPPAARARSFASPIIRLGDLWKKVSVDAAGRTQPFFPCRF